MKCRLPDCCEAATVHILSVTDRRLAGDRHVCEDHKWNERPFCEPGRGVTGLGSGVTGGVNAFDLCYVVLFDTRQADGLLFREVSGAKQFGIPVVRHQALALLEALQKTGDYSRPFTFAAFGMILQRAGLRVEQVIVDHLEAQGEYYQAKIKLQHADRNVVIDVRPSDAFGLALACDAPILVADDVLAKAAELGWTQLPSS